MKIESPNEGELAYIRDHLGRAWAMAEKYGGGAETPLGKLDGLWTSWSRALRESGDDPNPLINMVGIALGQHLVDEVGLTWVIATDEHGTELAVHGATSNMLVFPCNLVAKRWQAGETQFIEAVGTSMIRDIRALQTS